MKTKLFLSAFIILSVSQLKAQSNSKVTDTYSKGTNVASVGIGLGSSIAGYSYGSQTPGISLQYERGVAQLGSGVISIGGYLGFKSYKYSAEGFSEKWSYTIIGVRGAYHLTNLNIKNLDLYGGLMLSYNNLHFSDSEDQSGISYGSAAGFSAFVGGRYYFSKSIAGFSELGYGVTYLNLGVALKF